MVSMVTTFSKFLLVMRLLRSHAMLLQSCCLVTVGTLSGGQTADDESEEFLPQLIVGAGEVLQVFLHQLTESLTQILQTKCIMTEGLFLLCL